MTSTKQSSLTVLLYFLREVLLWFELLLNHDDFALFLAALHERSTAEVILHRFFRKVVKPFVQNQTAEIRLWIIVLAIAPYLEKPDKKASALEAFLVLFNGLDLLLLMLSQTLRT